MDKLSAADLTIDVGQAEAGQPLRVTWLGKSADRSPATILAPWFEKLLAEAKAGATVVEMHFERLEHFNSSTITALIRLIQNARNAGVRLVMVYDQNLKWQRLSFDALRVFEKGDDLFQLKAAQP